MTYKPKLALQDASRALGKGLNEAMVVTKALPNEFDEMAFDDAVAEFPAFATFAEQFQDVCKLAYKMVHRTKAQGKHAGGLIISSVPLKDHVPLIMSDGQWTSAWTEGKNTQLSKMGFVKFDFLGLKTIVYIWQCGRLVKKNRGIDIIWDDMNPVDKRAGWETLADKTRHAILFDDEKALKMAHELRTETIFQLDTELAKSIILKGGVKSLNDITVYTSLGRPGPLPMIDEYVKRRDGLVNWRKNEHPEIIRLLESTFGVVVFQEQLAAVWQTLAGFTIPESEAARKAVAKKWADKLKPIKEKWIIGASTELGEKVAKEWWTRMETFGRYAFNKSHAVAYSIVAYRCLWLKSHYPAEWWAAVMSDCKREKLVEYMGVARRDGVQFGPIDINNLSAKFSVKEDVITPGLNLIKGIGDEMGIKLASLPNSISSFDEFIEKIEPNKTVVERLIRLGAFDSIYKNRKILWHWYMYAYNNGEDARKIQKAINWALRWSNEEITAERNRQAIEFKKLYPKKSKLPTKILNWIPTTSSHNPDKYDYDVNINKEEYKNCTKIVASFKDIEALIKDDSNLKEILTFEKEYYGFYWHSPMGIFETEGHTIQSAKKTGKLECIIDSVTIRKGIRNEFYQLMVHDGIETARVMVWSDEIVSNDEDVFKQGVGVIMQVDYSEKYHGFNIKSGTQIFPLSLKIETKTEPCRILDIKD